jgi:phosphoribosylanthranilate isomerase
VIHVQGPESVEVARAAAPEVDALLLDSGRPDLPVKELGGTGRVHDWETSRAIRAAVDVPVYLAGGLRAENVGRAIETVRPFGVDLCSGIRTNGRLDARLLTDFMRAVVSAG